METTATWQKNTRFWAENPEKAHLTKILPSPEHSPFTSSWTSPSSRKTNDRKEVEADEEQHATQNTINFKRPVKLQTNTREKKKRKKTLNPARK